MTLTLCTYEFMVKFRSKDTMECLLNLVARSLWIQAYLRAGVSRV